MEELMKEILAELREIKELLKRTPSPADAEGQRKMLELALTMMQNITGGIK